jgi:3-isopropylmalate/(R)-2-methylmalate dehydratase small subunit
MTANTQAIRQVEGRAIPLGGDNVDTDRIIPARYLRCVTFDGLGEYAFYDERYQDGQPVADHPLNHPRYQGGEILVVGANFGCGSSREHAPQALLRYGIRAIVGESFAEIFAGNCVSIGLPVATLPAESLGQLRQLVTNQPETVVTVDLEALSVAAGSLEMTLSMAGPGRQALLSGEWDMTRVLLRNQDAVGRMARRLPYLNSFAVVSH